MTKFSRLKTPNIKFLDKSHKHRVKFKNNSLNLKLLFIFYIEFNTFIGDEDPKQFMFVHSAPKKLHKRRHNLTACVFEEAEGKQQAKSSTFEGTKGEGEGRRRGGRGGKRVGE